MLFCAIRGFWGFLSIVLSQAMLTCYFQGLGNSGRCGGRIFKEL